MTFAAALLLAAELATVAGAPGYNSWPMIGRAGDRVVCAYSKGERHSIGEGVRGSYAKWSADGGRTWSEEILVDNPPESGEVPIGRGRLPGGSMLLWNRAANCDKTHHDLFRTRDGATWERLATLRPDPLPMQITDVMSVDGRLVSFWFACSYGQKGTNAWGLMISEDGGRTWNQTSVERLDRTEDLPTEQCGVYLGNGRFFAVARSEGTKGQYQLTSADGGKTWKKARTNIRDVSSSTPSLVYDAKTDTVWNYYYNRADGTLRRRIAKVSDVFASPTAWPEPEILFVGGGLGGDAGNVNVLDLEDVHLAAFYDGQMPDTAVRVLRVAPNEGAANALALDAVFTDHMVLQRNRPLRFSGATAAGATVSVTMDGVSASARAGGDGRWSVELPARAEGGPFRVEAKALAADGKTALGRMTLEDVMVGEVWLGSGQSNMEFWVLGENLEEPPFYHLTNGNEVAATKDPLLRVLCMPHGVSAFGPRLKPSKAIGWKRAETREANGRMSAVAFLFGQELRRRLGPNVPVGIASAAWGGTQIEPWISEAQFRKSNDAFDLARLAAARRGDGPSERRKALAKAVFEKRGADLAAWSARLRQTGRKPAQPRPEFVGPGVTVKRIAFEVPSAWDGHAAEFRMEGVCDFDRTRLDGAEIGATGLETPNYWSVPRTYRVSALKAGRHVLEAEIEHHCGRAHLDGPLTLRDRVSGETLDLGKLPCVSEVVLAGNPCQIGYRPPDPYNGVANDPMTDPQMPTALFNAMIAPLAAMNVGGVIWYQGCANMADAVRYAELQEMLVDSWRTSFRNQKLPFLITQVSTYDRQTPAKRQPDDFWKAQTIPFEHLGFGPLRLAQEKMLDYPQVGVACTIDIGDHSDIHPPNKAEVARRLAHEAMRVAFGDATCLPSPRAMSVRRTADGVVVTFRDVGTGLVTDGGKTEFHPHLFQLAGEDGVFVWAEGRLSADDRVLVTASDIRDPKHVRYCVSACPVGVGLRRKDDGLPVMPFELVLPAPPPRYDAIHPGAVWLDTSGCPIQAHGGSIICAGGTYYFSSASSLTASVMSRTRATRVTCGCQ